MALECMVGSNKVIDYLQHLPHFGTSQEFQAYKLE